MKRIVIFAVSAIAVFMGGCAAPHYNMERAMETVRERASFDMGCDRVSSQLLGDVVRHDVSNPSLDGEFHHSYTIREMIIGVTGCGKRASYFVRCRGQQCTSRLDAVSE